MTRHDSYSSFISKSSFLLNSSPAISVQWLQTHILHNLTAAQLRSSPILKTLKKQIEKIKSEGVKVARSLFRFHILQVIDKI